MLRHLFSDRTCWTAALLGCCAIWTVGTALAKPAYLEEFQKRYTPHEQPAGDVEERLYTSVREQKCLVCHLAKDSGKADPKRRNRYGMQLSAAMRQLPDLRGPAKTARALEVIELLRTDPDDPKSPTFGERIQSGKLMMEE